MKVIGIISEYNPFHTGHMYQISETRKRFSDDTAVICVMSGNWTQQANCAIADKWTRARLALMGGADLVLELPTLWATASAERFALGGVSLLASTGLVDHISFGSECGSIPPLAAAAQCLNSPEYTQLLRSLLPNGKGFAVCRQEAVETLAGKEIGTLLRHPNNNLGIEYIRAINTLGSTITPITVQRSGTGYSEHIPLPSSTSSTESAAHQAFHANNTFLSATSIRRHLSENRWDLMEPYLPIGGRAILEQNPGGTASLIYAERAVLARLRSMTVDDWSALPDSAPAEGLPQRLMQAAQSACSIEEFLSISSTKRYTNARLQRLILWAFLGLTERDFRMKTPPYLRVLGCSETGRILLKQMKKSASLPVITKAAHVRTLDSSCRQLFETESRCTDLYDLCLPRVPAPGREWTTSPILL